MLQAIGLTSNASLDGTGLILQLLLDHVGGGLHLML